MSSSSPNASSPSFGEMITKVIDYKQLEVMDYLRSGALLAAFLVVLIKSSASGRGNLFAIGDVIGTGLCGLACYFFPAGYLSYQVSQDLSYGHYYFVQLMGAVLIGTAWARYRSLQSRDAYCTISIIISRLIGSVLLLMLMLHAQFTLGDKLTSKHITHSILGCVLWLLNTLLDLYNYNGKDRLSMGGGSPRDAWLLIIGLISFNMALSQFAFPQYVIGVLGGDDFAPDEVHIYKLQQVGILLIIEALTMLAAVNFASDRDRKARFEGILVLFALYLPMLLLYQLKHAISSRIWVLLLMSATHVTVALIGYCDGANCSWCSFLRLKSKAQ